MPLYPMPMRQMAMSYRAVSVTRLRADPHCHAANRIVIRCAPEAFEQGCCATFGLSSPQLIDKVARRSGPWRLAHRQVREALHGTLDVTTDQMAEGSAVTMTGFGRFEAKEHKHRCVVGLGSEEYEVKSRPVPSFHPYASLRQKVQGKTDERLKPKPGKVPLRWSDDPYS